MDRSRIGTDAVELLSRVTGEKLRQEELTPSVIFVSAMCVLLLGVMFVDGSIDAEEKRHLQATLKRFVEAEGDLRRLTQLMLKGVKTQKLYSSSKPLVILTDVFSEPEKLLLMSFGYQMSTADGEIHPKEQRYLTAIAERINITPKHLAVLEAGFTRSPIDDTQALAEVRKLLDPVRFQNLEPVFIEAASSIEELLPDVEEERSQPTQAIVLSHGTLAQFQDTKEQVGVQCYQLLKILQEFNQRDILPNRFVETIQDLFKRFSQKAFRISVIGEFSKGKSTMLNALLGEKVQPDRAIPCSGTISILRYGKSKRVICHYKDGRVEDIPFEQYKEQVTISREAAEQNLSDELSKLEVQHVVMENPGLEFCKNGVEIIDSPGLNEHPERTKVTQDVIADADAIIFMTSAQNVLTESERDLLDNIRVPIKDRDRKSADSPSRNIFVVVNFMDMLDDDDEDEGDNDDRLGVKRRVENFCFHESFQRIDGDNRLHYISAKKALNATLKGRPNRYLHDFQAFKDAVEKFLIHERGSVQLEKFYQGFASLSSESITEIAQYKELCQSQLDSQKEAQVSFDRIGEICASGFRIERLSQQLIDGAWQSANSLFVQWIDRLEDTLNHRRQHWKSEHNAILSRDKLLKDYVQQFDRDLSSELKNWIEQEFLPDVIEPRMSLFRSSIEKELDSIKLELSAVLSSSRDSESSWVFQIEPNLDSNADDEGLFGFSLGTIGLGVALLIPGVMFGPLLATVAGIVAGGGLAGMGLGGILFVDDTIREQVVKKGIEQFKKSQDSIAQNLERKIFEAFQQPSANFQDVVKNAISLYENRIEQLEKIAHGSEEQLQAELEWIDRKQTELQQVQQEIDNLLS